MLSDLNQCGKGGEEEKVTILKFSVFTSGIFKVPVYPINSWMRLFTLIGSLCLGCGDIVKCFQTLQYLGAN